MFVCVFDTFVEYVFGGFCVLVCSNMIPARLIGSDWMHEEESTVASTHFSLTPHADRRQALELLFIIRYSRLFIISNSAEISLLHC